jgi:hypothetical protein
MGPLSKKRIVNQFNVLKKDEHPFCPVRGDGIKKIGRYHDLVEIHRTFVRAFSYLRLAFGAPPRVSKFVLLSGSILSES